jgi:integrase
VHIRGLLHALWDYAMWRRDVPTTRNPMDLVKVKDASQRVRKTRSLTSEQFQMLLSTVNHDAYLCTVLLVAVSFGLRTSEVLGLKWKDVDWLGKTVRIERGVVKQIVDDVKSTCSARTKACADALLDVLKQWRQTTQFSEPERLMFASPYKHGKQPLSHSFIWENLGNAAVKAGIGHISSHTFRHTHRTWLDSFNTPVGVQKQLMRHADIRTTMNVYGDAATADMRQAHEKVVGMALNGLQTDCKRIATPTKTSKIEGNWGGRRESNPQRPEPQSGALPVELLPPHPFDYSNGKRNRTGWSVKPLVADEFIHVPRRHTQSPWREDDWNRADS